MPVKAAGVDETDFSHTAWQYEYHVLLVGDALEQCPGLSIAVAKQVIGYGRTQHKRISVHHEYSVFIVTMVQRYDCYLNYANKIMLKT